MTVCPQVDFEDLARPLVDGFDGETTLDLVPNVLTAATSLADDKAGVLTELELIITPSSKVPAHRRSNSTMRLHRPGAWRAHATAPLAPTLQPANQNT